MLRQSAVRCVRTLHTSRAALAPKTSGPKASAQGFRKDGDSAKSSKKSAGSFRFFEDHVHAARYSKTSEVSFENLGFFKGKIEEGSVLRFTERQINRLTECGAFKKDQFTEIFPSPVTLVRPETKQIESLVQSATKTPSTENRVCIVGERGIGKSTLLSQSIALAVQQSGAVVIPIPSGLRLVDGSNDYWFDNKLQIYTQPMYTKNLLHKIRHANIAPLSKIKLTKEYTIESSAKGRAATKFNTQHTLLDLLKGKFAGRQRGQVLQILIDELMAQSQSPVFVTVDNFSAITASPKTAYKSVNNKALDLTDLQITKLILDLTSGTKSFQKGAVILSTSADDRETFTLSAPLGLEKPSAYTSTYLYNPDVASKLAGVKPIEVGKLPKEYVGSLVGVLAQAGAFRSDELEQNTMDQLTNQKYILSGNGNPLELIKSVALYL